MDEYKSNSRLSKNDKTEEPKKEKVEKVVKGVVTTKKKNGLLGNLLSGDIFEIQEYVLQDVLIPAVKNTIEDIITNSVSMLLNNGETRKGSKRSTASRVSYRSYYEREENDRGRRSGGSSSNDYSYDNITVETRAEADDVINRLDELIDVYGMASIGDLYDLIGISGQYTDNKYGWTDVRTATHVRVRGGYRLKLPRAKPL